MDDASGDRHSVARKNGGPAEDDVRAELGRLLASDKIARNANTSRFLRYVVDETLEGRGERLKAFSIGTQALGRSDDFDPQTDSIVRVQAVRVRAQLESYYAGPGAENRVRITLPKGAYQPKFEFAPTPAVVELVPPPAPPPPVQRAPPAESVLRPQTAALATIAVGLVLVVSLSLATPWRRGASRPLSDPPMLSIHTRNVPKAETIAAAADRTLTLVETDAAASEYVRVRRTAAFEADAGADYDLEARFSAAGENAFDVAFVLTEHRTGETIWSKRFDGVLAGDRERQGALASKVAAASGEIGGVLLTDVYRRLQGAGAPLVGLHCRLTALNYLLARQESLRQSARDCLEAQLARTPDDAHSLTLLSTLLVNGYLENIPGSKGEADVAQGMEMARRAYDLTPTSVNALAALFYARFAAKRYDDAFSFAARMMEQKPDAVLVRLRLGRAFVARARYAEGVAELEALEAQLGSPQPVATAYLALAALMRDDLAALTRYEGRISAAATPLGLLLGMIDCRLRGDWEGVRARKLQMENRYPQISRDYAGAFDRYGLEEGITRRLSNELTSLGLAQQE